MYLTERALLSIIQSNSCFTLTSISFVSYSFYKTILYQGVKVRCKHLGIATPGIHVPSLVKNRIHFIKNGYLSPPLNSLELGSVVIRESCSAV